MVYVSLYSIGNFLMYLAMSCAYLFVFMMIFIKLTPYDDIEHVRDGRKTSSIILVGAMFGFTAPLLIMSYYGVNFLDFMIWSAIAMAIQFILFRILYLFIPHQLEENNEAAGIFFAGAAVCVGLINAFSLIPHQ